MSEKSEQEKSSLISEILLDKCIDSTKAEYSKAAGLFAVAAAIHHLAEAIEGKKNA